MFQSVKIREGHDNFFTPIRLLLSIMVVFGHAFVITTGSTSSEPYLFFEFQPSYIAVNIFFIASGFLVTKSMLYRKDIVEYAAARICRIYPALFALVLFITLGLGPLMTSTHLPDYLLHPDVWMQFPKVLTFADTDMNLPGLFSNNPESLAGGPLWTLRYEVLCYIGTCLAFALGLMRHKSLLIAQFLVFVLAWPIAEVTGFYDKLPATGQMILRFGLPYGLGVAIYALRDRLSFNIIGVIALGILAALTEPTPLFEVFTNIWLGYILFWLAFMKLPSLERFQSMSDLSYGIYIYHWVVMQAIFDLLPTANAPMLIGIGLAITIGLSWLSWTFVEKPVINRKSDFANWLKLKFVNRSPLSQRINQISTDKY